MTKLPLKRRKSVSRPRRIRRSLKPRQLDYPLQGSDLDVPIETVLELSEQGREEFVGKLIEGLRSVASTGNLALKKRIPFGEEMRDLRRVLTLPADQYLFIDDKNGKRNVLGKGSPGQTHTYWSRKQMWKMTTKGGGLTQELVDGSPSLVKGLLKLFDPTDTSKSYWRRPSTSAVTNALSFIQFTRLSGAAFPPFHAKFFADKFLPKLRDSIVFDPCAGWGGRLIGTLLVNRKHSVHYYATDPETRNEEAYEGLKRRATIWLKEQINGPRDATVFYMPFEDWVTTEDASPLFGKVDLVITSPPYFSAEIYNPQNADQSANRYTDYQSWRENFYRALMKGAFDLLRPNGYFVLNIADVAEAPTLEKDARLLAREIGFVNGGFYKLAISALPSLMKKGTARAKKPHLLYVRGKMFKYEPVFVFRKPNTGSDREHPQNSGQISS